MLAHIDEQHVGVWTLDAAKIAVRSARALLAPRRRAHGFAANLQPDFALQPDQTPSVHGDPGVTSAAAILGHSCRPGHGVKGRITRVVLPDAH